MSIKWGAGYYDVIDISVDKLQRLFNMLIEKKFKRYDKFYWNQYNWEENSFQIMKSGSSYFIGVITSDKTNEFYRPLGFALYYFSENGTKCYLNSAEFKSLNGKEAYNYIAREFNDSHKLTIPKTFTVTDEEMLSKFISFQQIKECVPVGVIYSDDEFKEQELTNCYKADVSSCYASNICKGALPTLVDCKVIDGLAEPTEEYPFAFDLATHNIKIYNELDTRDWKYNYFYKNQYYKKDNFVVSDYNYTVLMKAADANFNDIYEELYECRNKYAGMKEIMNLSIGYMQKESNPNLAHIAAVVIARANQFILNKADELVKEGNVVLNINIDSIMWKGNKSKVATDDKYLGSFTYEYDGEIVDIYYKGARSYQIRDHNGNVDTKCSGMEKNDKRRGIWKSIKEVETPMKSFDINIQTLEVNIF